MPDNYFPPLEQKKKFDMRAFLDYVQRNADTFYKSLTLRGTTLHLSGSTATLIVGDENSDDAQFFVDNILQHINLRETDDPDYPNKVFVLDVNSGVGRLLWVDNTGGSPVFTNNIEMRQDGTVDIVTGPLLLPNGTAALPGISFGADTDTGFYRVTTNTIGISTAGTLVAQIDSDQILLNQSNATSPSYSFLGDVDTGLYGPGGNTVGLAVGGVSKLSIAGDTRIPGINDTTTAAAANVFINSTTGLMARSTSSLKFKPGWEYLDEGLLAKVELPTPITWHDEHGGTMIGFGTEHIGEVLFPAVQDNMENYDPRALIAVLSAKIKRLEAALCLS